MSASNISLTLTAQSIIVSVSIGIGVMAFFLNIIALLALFKSIQNNNNRSTTSLLILTAIEIVYTASRIFADSTFASAPRFFIYIRHLVNSSLLTRNLWTTLLSIWRTTAIITPFYYSSSHNVCRAFNPSSQITIAILLLLLSTLASIFMPSDFLIFIQVLLPVPLVIASSIITLIALLYIHNIRTVQHTNNYKASRTILALSISFSLLETPSLITIIILKFHHYPLLYLLNSLSNLFTICDSAINLIILLLCSRSFSINVKSVFISFVKICQTNRASQAVTRNNSTNRSQTMFYTCRILPDDYINKSLDKLNISTL